MTTKTKERPILFNDEMVRAILEGRKTQTRRPLKNQPGKFTHIEYDDDMGWHFWWDVICDYSDYDVDQERSPISCPFGDEGDELWVRECFCHKADQHGVVTGANGYWYRASDQGVTKVDEDGCIAIRQDGSEASPWTPSIHMPREASRIQLIVKRVWVERIQDMSENDARAEGIPPNHIGDFSSFDPDEQGFLDREGYVADQRNEEIFYYGHFTAKEALPSHWDPIYATKGYGWDDNAWVWCCEFEVKK